MKVVNSWATFLIVLVLLQQSLKEVGADLISDTRGKIDKSYYDTIVTDKVPS
jgi:hypothetical protein